MTEPPHEAYSRVTNPERFRPLHAFADAVVDALLQSYEVASVEHGVPVVYCEAIRPTERSVRIVPVGGGIDVTIAWTPFPGLFVAVGDETEAIPACGCDACNDDLFGLFEEFRRPLWDAVNGVRRNVRIGEPWIRQRQW